MKMTQQNLADKLNVTKGTISNYENGHSTPSNELLKDLSTILDVSTDYLLGKDDKKDSYEIKKTGVYLDIELSPKSIEELKEHAKLLQLREKAEAGLDSKDNNNRNIKNSSRS